MEYILLIGIGIGCLLLGGGLVYVIYKTLLKSRVKSIIEEADKEAEVIKKNKMLEVKEKFLHLKADMEKQANARNAKLQSAEAKAKQRELQLNQQQQELQRKKAEADAIRSNLDAQLEVIEKKKQELERLHKTEVEKLEHLSGLSADEAKEKLIESLKEEAKTEAASYINDIMDEAKLTANKEAKRIVIQSIQRVATETAIENSVTVFHIESDEIKGRIIGREGRNIRALEAATGVEIIVDDTPEAIVLSAFDPVRREIARLALHQLVTDGRIHPARIEEVVTKVRKQIEEEIIETGKRTAIDLGIHGLHPELIRLVGKMKYRSSYGQNLLQHSRETANLCAVMASELGLNPKKAKRAGLLHDIIEDTNITALDLLEVGIDRDIVETVFIVTKPLKEKTELSEEERLQSYNVEIDSIINSGNPHALRLKMRDMKNNYDQKRLELLSSEQQEWFDKKYGNNLKKLEKALESRNKNDRY